MIEVLYTLSFNIRSSRSNNRFKIILHDYPNFQTTYNNVRVSSFEGFYLLLNII